jgi:nitrite reductase/ring-hydroxylating ferredoxin subunit
MSANNRPRSDYLCALADLEATGAYGAERDDPPFRILVVRDGEAIRGYVNSCPHRGTPLEMFPHRFLDETRSELICATHGARFRVADGTCTSGPCRGTGLEPVPLIVDGGSILFVAD